VGKSALVNGLIAVRPGSGATCTLAPAPRMLEETPAQLAAHLAHPNGWWRDTAQKLLVLSQDKSVVPALVAMARTHANPLARHHALWTLEGLDALTPALVREKIADADPQVRVAAIRASETLFKRGERSLQPEILARYRDADPNIAIQAVPTAHLLKWPEAKPLTQQIGTFSASAGIKAVASQLLNPSSGQIPGGFGDAELKIIERGRSSSCRCASPAMGWTARACRSRARMPRWHRRWPVPPPPRRNATRLSPSCSTA